MQAHSTFHLKSSDSEYFLADCTCREWACTSKKEVHVYQGLPMLSDTQIDSIDCFLIRTTGQCTRLLRQFSAAHLAKVPVMAIPVSRNCCHLNFWYQLLSVLAYRRPLTIAIQVKDCDLYKSPPNGSVATDRWGPWILRGMLLNSWFMADNFNQPWHWASEEEKSTDPTKPLLTLLWKT